ncbi:MAG: hypothetical protein ACXAD7_21470, partial [Candidatus Kariarchaeaceae archaeon]
MSVRRTKKDRRIERNIEKRRKAMIRRNKRNIENRRKSQNVEELDSTIENSITDLSLEKKYQDGNDPFMMLRTEMTVEKKRKDFSPQVSSTFLFGKKYNLIFSIVIILMLLTTGFFSSETGDGPSFGDFNPLDSNSNPLNRDGSERRGLTNVETCEDLYQIAEER